MIPGYVQRNIKSGGKRKGRMFAQGKETELMSPGFGGAGATEQRKNGDHSELMKMLLRGLSVVL